MSGWRITQDGQAVPRVIALVEHCARTERGGPRRLSLETYPGAYFPPHSRFTGDTASFFMSREL